MSLSRNVKVKLTSLCSRDLVDKRSEKEPIWTIFVLGVKKINEASDELIDAQLAVAVGIDPLESLLCPRRIRYSELDKYSLVFVRRQVAVRFQVHQAVKGAY